MKLHHDAHGRVVAISEYEERKILKGAGFRWSPEERCWFTQDMAAALPLIRYANDKLRALLESHRQQRAREIASSRAVAAQIVVPAPEGLAYLPHQLAAIDYANKRAGVLCADEMGLGKSIVALGIINGDPNIRKALVICPAMLKVNWSREAERWLTRPFEITIVNGGKSTPDVLKAAESAFVIVNYDILNKHQALLKAIAWDLVVVDESHYCKNYKAARTKQATGLLALGRRRLALTGTPVLAAPRDLIEVLAALDPENWPNKFAYLRRYCAPKRTAYGLDFSGASNLPELHDKLRASVMVRRLKSEVLKDLPPKMRQIIVLGQDSREMREQVKREEQALREHSTARASAKKLAADAKLAGDEKAYRDAVDRLRAMSGIAIAEISRLRQETARLKLPSVIEHVQNSLEQTESRKVVVFAHHIEILQKLKQAFPANSVLVYGDVSFNNRQAAIDRFQTDPECQVFIGGIDVAGVGITLTAASHVVFAELDWTPAKMSQAEDRLHRIGQKNAITVQQVVVDGSIDACMAKTLLRKQEVIDRCLDGNKNNVEEDSGSMLEEILKDVENGEPKQKEAMQMEVIGG